MTNSWRLGSASLVLGLAAAGVWACSSSGDTEGSIQSGGASGSSGSGGSVATGGSAGMGTGGSGTGGSGTGGSGTGGSGTGGSGTGGSGTGGSGTGGSAGAASGGAGGVAGGGSGGTGSGGSAGAGTGGSAGMGTGGSGGGTPNTVAFVAFGDAGKGNAGQLKVAQAVAAKCAASGCDFVQLLGDNIYDDGVSSVNDSQWQTKFEQPYAGVNLPFWVVLGNHDYGGNGAGYELNKANFAIAYSNVSQKWTLPARFYLHQEPGVDFVGLDTNMAMFNQAGQQKTQVAQWFAQSTRTWKIAFGHHPYRSNGPHGNAGSYEGLPFVPIVNGAGVKDLLDSSVCGKADVYICGHDHSLQWLMPTCSGTELIVSGGGASNTDLPGNNQSRYQAEKSGFLYVRITGKTFHGEFYDENGNLEFSRDITKP